MTTTLVTGANKCIGRETARRLIGAGHDVYLGARDHDRGVQAAQELKGTFVQLDVQDDASVRGALAMIRDQRGQLDVLIDNAGIHDNTVEVADIDGDVALQVMDVNVAGVVRVRQAALRLLRASTKPVVVNVSSGLGSFAANTDPARPESSTPWSSTLQARPPWPCSPSSTRKPCRR